MKTLIKIEMYRDGGTTVYVEENDYPNIETDYSNITMYYLDKRIASKTRGEIFDKYPSEEGAIMLDKSQFILKDNT